MGLVAATAGVVPTDTRTLATTTLKRDAEKIARDVRITGAYAHVRVDGIPGRWRVVVQPRTLR